MRSGRQPGAVRAAANGRALPGHCRRTRRTVARLLEAAAEAGHPHQRVRQFTYRGGAAAADVQHGRQRSCCRRRAHGRVRHVPDVDEVTVRRQVTDLDCALVTGPPQLAR
ncbi:hypothetical protein ABT010_03715 [Streptomyces sp. NPDC002668]|uniref:hypothetical protein n=1 Tax=Streptomyces sp. NPDC002668 TaxID=3154422 RepID=UPI003330CDD3